MKLKSLSQQDPRLYQILILSTLLIIGFFFYDFPLQIQGALVLIGTALLTEVVLAKLTKKKSMSLQSALISSLSLILLLRSSHLAILSLAAFLSIASKFFLRIDGQHFFNPTNLGIVLTTWLFDSAWISPGQWGSLFWMALFLTASGLWVSGKAARWDVALMFLIGYSILSFGRAFYLGDPWTIPWHNLQNGALLIFSFFMITDPRTTPNTTLGRGFFVGLLLILTARLQWHFFRPQAFLEALFLIAWMTPILNRIFKTKSKNQQSPHLGENLCSAKISSCSIV
ncbi:MAG: RnfABCDGE type electron transport complex subunit D [Deltaproteobacteria bacterium]|nr:RnfABCDGE type electron transport complex subunit D [Deltaproteobacteria bacterium]